MEHFYVEEVYNENRRRTTDIYINTIPCLSNLSEEVVIDGWCGTNNDTAIYAHGEYDSLEEAQAFIKREFPSFQACSQREAMLLLGLDLSIFPTVIEAYARRDHINNL